VCAGCLNDFSSAGNIPVYFDRFGNRLQVPERRFNPSVTGPDGGNSTFFLQDSSYDDDDGDGLNSPFTDFISGLDNPADELPNFFRHVRVGPARGGGRRADAAEEPGADAGRDPLDPREHGAPARPTVHLGPPVEVHRHRPGTDGYNDDAGVGLVDAAAALERRRRLMQTVRISYN
jgi:hypothetical protein